VTRPNVTCCGICSASLVTVAARSRPSFAVRWGTQRARRMILSMRTIGTRVVQGRSGKSVSRINLVRYGRRQSGCCTLVLHADDGRVTAWAHGSGGW
jgi:hypothetical protein